MFRFRRNKDPEKNYINKAIIGLGVGLVRSKDLLLSPDFGPQGAMDSLLEKAVLRLRIPSHPWRQRSRFLISYAVPSID